MAIALTGTGGIFTRWGRIGKFAYLQNPYEASLPAAFTSLWAQYLSSLQPVNAPNQIQANQLTRLASGLNSGQLNQLAQQTLIGMVQADQPSIQPSVLPCLIELIRQMNVAAATVDITTVTAAVAPVGTPVGTPVIVTSTIGGNGISRQLMIPEVDRLQCVADSYTGGTNPGNEQYQFSGQLVTGQTWDYDWPQGSNANASLTAISTSSGTILTDGEFEVWAGLPLSLTNWPILVGVYGTDVIQFSTAAQVFGGTYSVKLANTGVASKFYQTLPTTLTPSTSYAVQFQIIADGAISAGQLNVELTDGTGTVVNDAQSVANTHAFSLVALPTTPWTQKSFVFRTPPQIPASGLRLQFRLSTGGVVGANCYLDTCAMASMGSPIYSGGPTLAIFGAIGTTTTQGTYSQGFPAMAGDLYSATMTQDFAGASYAATWQWLAQRFFNMTQLGLLLPFSNSPTISDTLITS